MPIPSPAALSSTSQAANAQQLRQGAERAQSQPWKLHQLLTARVVKLTGGETALRINGQLYTPVSPMPLTPGVTKQLRVASLDPVIKLTLVENGTNNNIPVRLLGAAVAPMSNSRWAATVSSGPYKLATLLSVFNNPPQVMRQNLSPQVQASMGAIAALLPSTNDLRSAVKLKQALAAISLSGKELGPSLPRDTTSELGRLLQTLHQQLTRQAQEQQYAAKSSWPVDSYKGEQAMRVSVSSTLLQILDDAMRTLGARVQRQGDHAFLPLMQWRWEFPLLEKSRGRLFSLSAWMRQRTAYKPGRNSQIWSLRCACVLANYGLLAIVLRVKNRELRVHLQCESENRLQRLCQHAEELRAQLSEFRIILKRYNCSVGTALRRNSNEERSNSAMEVADFEQQSCLSESLHVRLRHAAVTGMLPVLEDFTLQDGAGSDQSEQQLPDQVYQALASLFSVLVEEEK